MSTIGRNLDLQVPSARRDHVHLVAVLYVAATFMLLLGAMSSQNNLLFAIVGLALAAVIVSGFLAGSSMMGLRFARRVPARIEAATPARIVYSTYNKNRLISAFALRIVDSAKGSTGVTVPIRAGLGGISASGSAEAVATVELPFRGNWELGPGRLITMFPFGISKKSIRYDGLDRVVVMPKSVELVSGALEQFESAGDDGKAEVRRRGGGAELYNLREYQRGDPVSSIAWQASARWSKLISREVAMPQARRVWIVIESSAEALRDREPVAEAAVRLALASGRRLSELGVAAGLRVPSCGITVAADNNRSVEPVWATLLATLGDAQSQKSSTSQIRPGEGIIAIGSGATPGAKLVLDPAREDVLTLSKSVGEER